MLVAKMFQCHQEFINNTSIFLTHFFSSIFRVKGSCWISPADCVRGGGIMNRVPVHDRATLRQMTNNHSYSFSHRDNSAGGQLRVANKTSSLILGFDFGMWDKTEVPQENSHMYDRTCVFHKNIPTRRWTCDFCSLL